MIVSADTIWYHILLVCLNLWLLILCLAHAVIVLTILPDMNTFTVL